MIGGHVGHNSAVQASIDVGISQNDLDVAACLVKGNGFDELGRFPEGSPTAPQVRAPGTRIVGRQCNFDLAAIGIEQIAEIVGAELKVAIGHEKLTRGETPYSEMTRELPAGGWQQLHQAISIRV